MELNVEREEYIGKLSDEVGVQIQIGRQGGMPFPDEEGVSASPGSATKFGLRKVMTVFLNLIREKLAK